MLSLDRHRPAGLSLRQWSVLALLSFPMFMMATDFTAMFLAMPLVTGDLTPGSTQVLWLIHVGELVASGTLITMGWLTGRIGPRALLLIALGLYGAGSMVAAFSTNATTLITARALIGAATAAASPAALAMLRSLFRGSRQYGIGFAVVMGAFPVGAALGPPLTGLLLEHFWWGSVFLVNVPVAAVALVGGLRLFPPSKDRTTDTIDMLSVIVSTAAVMLLVFGIQELAARGFSVGYAIAVAAGIALAAWFVRRQRRISNPLLDLNLFAIRILRLMTVFFILSQVAFMVADFILIQYLQVALGVSTSTLGLLLIAPGVAAIVSTAMTPPLTRRFAPVTVMVAALAVSVAGVLVILLALLIAPRTEVFTVGMSVVAFGISPTLVLGAQLLITSVKPHQTGSAAAVQDISASIGAAGGIMLLGSVSLAVFARGVRSAAPEGIPADRLTEAEQSPGAAMAIAQDIDGPRGDALLTAAKDALSLGAAATYAIALAIGLLLIAILARALRGVRLPEDPDAGEDADAEAGEPDPAPGTPAESELTPACLTRAASSRSSPADTPPHPSG